MFADSVLINRRNVGADVRSRYSACKQFFLLEIECRVVAAAMVILNLKSLDDFPDEKHLPNDLEKRPIRKRKEFLENLASVVVDKYILQIDKVEDLLAKNK